MLEQVVDLKIDFVASYDPGRALNLMKAAMLVRGRKGHVHFTTLSGWANPAIGYQGQKGGPRLIFPTVKIGHERLTMPEWIEAFEKERARLGIVAPRPAGTRRETDRQRSASHRRALESLRKQGIHV